MKKFNYFLVGGLMTISVLSCSRDNDDNQTVTPVGTVTEQMLQGTWTPKDIKVTGEVTTALGQTQSLADRNFPVNANCEGQSELTITTTANGTNKGTGKNLLKVTLPTIGCTSMVDNQFTYEYNEAAKEVVTTDNLTKLKTTTKVVSATDTELVVEQTGIERNMGLATFKGSAKITYSRVK